MGMIVHCLENGEHLAQHAQALVVFGKPLHILVSGMFYLAVSPINLIVQHIREMAYPPIPRA
jgi:hypothetical protein